MQVKSLSKQLQSVRLFLGLVMTILLLSGNLASAQNGAAVTGIPELEKGLARVQETERAMKEAEAQGNQQAMRQARERNQTAERHMEQSLAQLLGVQRQDIAAMRELGMGWQQTCQELGIDPGLLGLGQYQEQNLSRVRTRTRERTRQRTLEQMQATMRQINQYGAPKHGLAAISHGSQGMGLGVASRTISHGSPRGFAGMSQGSSSRGGRSEGGKSGSGSGAGGSGAGGSGGGGSGGGGSGGGGSGAGGSGGGGSGGGGSGGGGSGGGGSGGGSGGGGGR